MNYGLKKKVIYSVIVLAMLFGFGYIAYFGLGSSKQGSADNIKLGLDLAGGVSITYETVEPNPSSQDLSDTVYKLQKRVEKYSTEAQVYKEGGNRITVEIPDVSDANAVLQELGTPGSLEFLDEAGYQAKGAGSAYTPLLTGSDVKSASAYTDSSANTTVANNSKYGVQLQFTDEGSQKFATATSANIGKIIYIVYDGEVVSYPSVNEAITGGSAVINNMESYETADKLASFIRIGSIPLELKEVHSNVVGAQLGNEAINTSVFAAAIGLLLLFIFMIVVYRLPGFAATIALLVYTGLIVFLINAYDITLTLPGIAGIILTIGMAVDANIIIYSRIKEEIGFGKTVEQAIKIGFHKALPSIIDSHVTNLIAAFILMFKGSGGVKGFAQTLAIGVLLSLFTSLVVSETITRLLYSFGFKDPKYYGSTVHKKNYNFLGRKNFYLLVTVTIIVVGFATMITNQVNGKGAFNYSLEFVGGTSTTVTFNEDMSQSDIEQKVIPVIQDVIGANNTVQQQKVNDSTQVIFKTSTLDVTQREAMNAALEEKFNLTADQITAETISSSVSETMRNDAIIAVAIAIVCMLIYIWIRFNDVKFGTSAVIALLIDLLFLLSFYAISRITVGNTFIACMLTILGFSINATIVIFDRIREHLKTANSKTDIKELVNECITVNLSRSINTNFTAFLMLLMLYIFGVDAVREFALPLMVGIVGGAYSSVCITGGLWYTFKMYGEKRSAKIANK